MNSDESVELPPRQKRQTIRYGRRNRMNVGQSNQQGTSVDTIAAESGKRKRGIVEGDQISTDESEEMEETNVSRDEQVWTGRKKEKVSPLQRKMEQE
jgi:hypothetical protein